MDTLKMSPEVAKLLAVINDGLLPNPRLRGAIPVAVEADRVHRQFLCDLEELSVDSPGDTDRERKKRKKRRERIQVAISRAAWFLESALIDLRDAMSYAEEKKGE